MCVILDACIWSKVFKESNQEHHKFKPIFDWLYEGKRKGKIVYGGSKYDEELRRSSRLRRSFIELGKRRQVVKLRNDKVDQKEQEIEAMPILQNTDFNDAHIVAIVTISGCRIICSEDKHAKLLRESSLYPKRFGKVRVYRGKSDKDFLLDHNVKKFCKLCRPS